MRNDKAIVKKGKPILLIAIAVIVLMGALLVSCGKKPAQESTDATVSVDLPKEVTVTDEQTLRELLLAEGEMTICVAEDMEVDQQFIVKGTKTLTGDAVIRMSLSAEWYQSLLVVSEGATLQMDGLVLDGNYIADGIHMEENANLVYLSGKIWRTDVYGIQAMGNVSIQDVTIEKAEYIGIYAKKGSKVTIEGGSLSDTATHDIYVDSEAAVDIIGNARFKDCMGDSVINYGTLNVHDGTFSGATSYTFNNYGVLNIDYAGAKVNGYVECSGSRLGVVCTRTNAQTNINRLHVAETTRQAVVTVGGETVITDSLFEKTGYHAIEIQAGEAEITNVTVNEAGDAGLEIYTKGVVSVKDFTVNSAAGIGITCRGGKITGSNISIANTGKYGISCGSSTNGTTAGKATVSDIVIKDTGRSGAYAYGGATMELKNAEITGSGSRGIYIAEESKCTLSGKSIISQSDYRGVEVRGTFTMESGSICRNYVSESGAGVYVSPKGYFVMEGGSIFNNSSGLRGGGICVTEGKVTINAGDVYNNTAANNGGGLYAQKGAEVTLRTGSIKDNRSSMYGDGIYVVSEATKLTMSGDFYVGENDVKIDDTKIVMTITRDGLSKHTKSDPLHLTPKYSASEGTVLATCKSEAVAKAVAAKVAAGDGSYVIVRDGKNLVVKYATADMDMTGADKVYVSSFRELKAAVEGATSKRNIILKADIVFPERIRLPGGVTIRIQDDGTPRTLTRANGFTDNLFVTHYGTGLYLEGTQQGNLILDGTCTATANVQSLVRTAGSTVIRNAVLRNNGVAVADGDVRGALFRQLYGDFKIVDSVLTGGSCNSGGAIMIDKGTGYIEDTTFSNNTSVIGGGAIRAAANTQLEIVNSAFDKNHAGSSGGAIVAVGGAQVKITDTSFKNNTAKTFGGAVNAQGEGTSVVISGTDAAKAVFENNSSQTAGAVCVHTNAQLTVSDYTFTENKATDGRAGAIAVNSGAVVTLENSGFYKNEAAGSGGVLASDGGKVSVINCELGKVDAGNTAGDKGGAILVTGAGEVELKATADAQFSSVSNNSAVIGGAICAYNGQVSVDNYTLSNNYAKKDGGAVYVAADAKLNSDNCAFVENTAANRGAAIYSCAPVAVTGSSFEKNAAKKEGGALYAAAQSDVTVLKSEFVQNEGITGGGAIYVEADAAVTNTGSVFTQNSSTANGNGGAVHVKGTYTDTNSTYTGNTGKNGGAIAILGGGSATITGTDANAVFSGNSAAAKGSAVFINSGSCTGSVEGYTFTGNTGNGEFYVVTTGSGTLKNVTFNEGTAVADGELTINNVTGATLVQGSNAAGTSIGKIYVAGFDTSNQLTVKPYKYEGGHRVLWKADGTEDADFAAACAAVTIAKDAFGTVWPLEEDGTLRGVAAVARIGSNDFSSLNAAIAYANENGGTGDAADMTIELLTDVALTARVTISKNVAIVNASGKDITICRASGFVDDMFYVSAGKLTLGTNADSETGKLIVDGTSADTISKRILDNRAGATFVLARNAVLENSNSNQWGAAFVNRGTAHLYGTIRNNVCTGAGGAVLQIATADGLTIHEGTYTGNRGTRAKECYGGFLRAEGSTVEIKGGTFADNSATHRGGALYLAGTAKATITGGTFTNNTSGDGSAIYILTNASASLKDVVLSAQQVQVEGVVTVNNVTGATLVQGENGKIYVASVTTTNQLTVKPYKYEGGHQVLWKADGADDSAFAAACAAVTVANDGAGNEWSLNAEGKLDDMAIAVIGTERFSSLDAAMEYANTNGGTGDAADMTIKLLKSVALTKKLTVGKNIAIVNESGKDITISRDAAFTGAEMFQVTGKLTLGTNDAAHTGTLTVDAATASRISKRAIANDAGATFVLARNAILENAWNNQWGAALINKGIAHLYGTIRNNNCENGAGGAVLMHGDSNQLIIYEGTYSGNTATRANDCFGGFLRVEAGSLEIRGGVFENNSASHHGGAVYVKGATSVSITGATFTNNTSGNGNAIYIPAGVTASLKDISLSGQQIQVDGSVRVNNVTGATLVQGENGKIYAASITAANKLAVKPYKYESGYVVLTKAEGVEDSAFAQACAAICVSPDPTTWVVTASGALQGVAAWVGDQSFSNFTSALEYANTVENATIVLNSNVGLAQKAVITKNITITCKAGNEVTVSRNFESDDMFQVVAGATLTLGTGDGGTLIVNGASASAIGYRTVNNAGQFVLSAKASLVNANSTLNGAALYNSATAVLSGNVTANKVGGGTSGKGGALYCEASSTTTISGGTYSGNEAKQGGAIYVLGSLSANGTVFSTNKSNGAEGGAIYVDATKNVSLTGCAFNGNYGSTAGAIYVVAGGKVECENGSYTGNTSPGNGGAVHVKGTYIDINSSYTNNSGKNGGAVAVLGGGSATFTGTNTNAFFSGNSATAKGSAIFVNSGGCSASATGYTFTGNTTGDSAVYIVSGGSGILKNDVFSGETAQKITVAGTLEYWNITGASIEGAGTKTEKE